MRGVFAHLSHSHFHRAMLTWEKILENNFCALSFHERVELRFLHRWWRLAEQLLTVDKIFQYFPNNPQLSNMPLASTTGGVHQSWLGNLQELGWRFHSNLIVINNLNFIRPTFYCMQKKLFFRLAHKGLCNQFFMWNLVHDLMLQTNQDMCIRWL